jgi:hypothetical protein
MTLEKNLTPSNSSIIVTDLNEFLKANKLIYDSYCRVFEKDRVLISICWGDKDIGNIFYHSVDNKWCFQYYFDAQDHTCEKLTILINAWLRYILNKDNG